VDTPNQNKTRIIIAIVGLIVVVGLWRAISSGKPSGVVKTVPGTVTAIDVANRQATVEIKNSKTGEAFSMTGPLPDDSKIRVDGKPATARDVQVGDKVFITRQGKGTTILSVDVERELPTSKTKPTATAPAGGA
jgi:hypothetical protein